MLRESTLRTTWGLLFCLVGLVLACSSSGDTEWVRHREWSAETQFSRWSDAGHRGLAVGFVRPEHRDVFPYNRPSTHEFHIQEGESFTILLILATGYDEPYPVLVSVFLDYRQVSFSLDGQQGLLHYLEIEPDVDMEIPLEVPIEASGWHDLFVVVFPEPDFHPIDPEERLPPALAVGGRRTVVCVRDCATSTQKLPDALVGRGNTAHRLNVYAFPVLPGDDRPPNERLLLSTTARPGELFPLELWARNSSERARDYVVLPLLDFRQFYFAGSDVLHLRMPPGSELFVADQLRLPNEEGVHELQFIYIFDAYQALDEVTDPFVQSVMRSAFLVEGEE